MRKKFILIMIIVAGLTGCANRYHPFSMDKPDPASFFPPSHFAPGWSRDKGPTSYNPDNLYKYIDGSAELYLSYGFRKLVSSTYLYEKKEDNFLIMDIYDMGSGLNAFGIYSSYRGTKTQLLRIGTEVYLTDNSLTFYKGKNFVYLQSGRLFPETGAAMKKAAQMIAGKIPGRSERPLELSYLPGENMMERTSKYIPNELLGYRFLPGGIRAEYQLGRKKSTLFIALCYSPQEATDSFREYVEQIKKRGKNLTFRPDLFKETFFADDPYYGKVLVTRHRRFLVGITNLSNFQEGESLLRATLARIEMGEERAFETE